MKPKGGTFAENALRHGVAGLNIDGGRINPGAPVPGGGNGTSSDNLEMSSDERPKVEPHSEGRWPANVVLDEAAAELVDEQSGVLQSGSLTAEQQRNGGFAGTKNAYGDAERGGQNEYESNSGGASRFFYTAKASKSDRNAGLPPGEENTHPTVKPTDLMGWLLRLVEMPRANLILDPFCGSGTTLYVAQQMGLPAIGIDQDEESCELASKRLSEPSLFS
jgi:site-specific DNA-methyltransferase (adenine-specific)